jgi:hypothetical protein
MFGDGVKDNTSVWMTLFRVGGIAALTIVLLIPIQIVIFVVWPPPNTVIGWFTLFQDSPVVGLIDMDLLLIVDYVLVVMVFLALWAALRRINESLMIIALFLQMISAATYFASTVAFEMLSLSSQYMAASTDAQRSIILAAGQAMLAIWEGTAFDISYILAAIATLMVSAVMLLRSQLFGRITGYAGIVASLLMFVPASAGMIGLFFSLVSLGPYAIWLALVSERLLQLAHSTSTNLATS